MSGGLSLKRLFAPRNTSTYAPSTSHLIKSGAADLRTYSSTETASTRIVLGADLSASLSITCPKPRSGDTSASARAKNTGFEEDHTAFSSTEIGHPNSVPRFRAAVPQFPGRLESRNSSGGTHQTRSKERKETNVRANIVHRHSRTQIFAQHDLHFRLDIAMEIIAARAGIQVQPNSLSRAVLHLNPRQRATRDELRAGPAQPWSNYRELRRSFVNGAAKRKKALPRPPSEKLKLLLHQKTANAKRIHS
jgi:hypothetical protein